MYAAQDREPLPEISPPPKALSGGPPPNDFVTLEVRETDLVLTNISDRPINAWIVKTVVRSSQGHEAYMEYGKDAYRSSMFPGGEEELLEPGESVTIEKGEAPWIREDLRGPGSGVFYEVGAVTFEGGDAAGDPDVLDTLFTGRVEDARVALRAIQASATATARDAGVLDDLPQEYRSMLQRYASREEALYAIYQEAWEDYKAALANLRPEDLAELPQPEEVLQ